MNIDQHTALYGVIGYPIGHSLSPTMLNAAFAACNLNAVYLAFETNDLQACLSGVRSLGIRGLSVTLPHKSDVLPLLDEVHPLAQRIGAVNTIVNVNGRLAGYNTDAIGVLKALEQMTPLDGKSALIIGAGGAARAAGYTLKEIGVDVMVASRSEGRGRELARTLACPFILLDELDHPPADLIINTTPVGMVPQIDQCPVPERVFQEGMAVMDIIYNPLETLFLQKARACGCRTINGLSMFVHQGAEQFRLWTGIEPPLDIMTRAVEQALVARDSTG